MQQSVISQGEHMTHTSNLASIARTNNSVSIESLIKGTTEIAVALVSRTPISTDELPNLLRGISHELIAAASACALVSPTPSLGDAAAENMANAVFAEPEAEAPAIDPRWAGLRRTPVLPIEESVKYEAIICLFDGRPMKMLKRYIRAKYGMTEADYKAWFGLPDDYPMVAPGYAAEKRAVAISQGFGRR
jgi:predicted transcriptional regulator